MRRLVIILFLIFTSVCAHADPGKRTTREERQLAREERQKARIEKRYALNAVGFDERGAVVQKRQAMFVLTIAAIAIVAAIGQLESQ